jgi:ATP-dependent helicase Lhr and Lhr-like helicase
MTLRPKLAQQSFALPVREAEAPSGAHQALLGFHPVVQAWFHETYGEPTAPQIQGWPRIAAGDSILIAAPTGSGKTLTAFLSCLDRLFREALDDRLPALTQVLYVSPLKALGNDIEKNLLQPLEQLKHRAARAGLTMSDIRVGVRTGDTSPAERQAMLKKPPHILITTPESFYLCLTAAKSRAGLSQVHTVVVDELHALARDKRGSHFALSMERLKGLRRRHAQTDASLQCIGLSATIRPLDTLAAFLGGMGNAPAVLEIGHVRPWDLTVQAPDDELSAVATHEMWGQLYDRIVQWTTTHRTVLVFTNTRKLAERVAHDLGERLGHEQVAAHHGSMSKELRVGAEQRLRNGVLKVMVATASLELGLDIGSIDLVVQVGTPRNIAVMLQRLGRSGHRKTAVSKGILFAMTRDDLLECTALLRAIVEKRLDAVRIPEAPLDVLAQQLVAEVAAQDWDEDELFELVKRATPYRTLTRAAYQQVLKLVSEGVGTHRGRSRVHLHHDRVNGWLKPRKGARLMALQNGGAIADLFTYPVVAEPEEKQVGTLDEDFAVESSAGDVFVLGATSWRIRRVYDGQVRVENANGQAPSVPFWRGESPGRTDELSQEVGQLRELLANDSNASSYLQTSLRLTPPLAEFLVDYVKAAAAVLTAVPSTSCVVAERFFDEAGGMQLILHAPFGARINRAWGLSLRKSFCRAFDFELQAAASDDGILLSLGEQHSFPLADIFHFVHPDQAPKVLTQAVLQAPIFGTRFRWAAGRALTLSRLRNGKRVPPPIQRAKAEDLIAAVFPAQLGCQDNHGGADIEPPDHPLVNESLKDCLTDFMDLAGFQNVLRGMREGSIQTVAVDLPEPSVFAHQLLNSAPWTFLDEAPLEERRARAVSVRRSLPKNQAQRVGALDTQAIDTVVSDAQPPCRDEDELHDLLLQLVVASPEQLLPYAPEANQWLASLASQGRVAACRLGEEGQLRVCATERIPLVQAVFPEVNLTLSRLAGDADVEPDDALSHYVRGWLEVLGPTTAAELSTLLHLSTAQVDGALARIELSGQVLRGQFRPSRDGQLEWCDRRLLQRIHQLTVGRLRREIEPLSPQDFMRFLFRWHFLGSAATLAGPQGINKIVSRLQGYEAPAASWEHELIAPRMKRYFSEWLDYACMNGDIAWGRLTMAEPKADAGLRRGLFESSGRSRSPTLTKSGALTFFRREDAEWLLQLARRGPVPQAILKDDAASVLRTLETRGASFFLALCSHTGLPPAQVEAALTELLALGHVTADVVQNLRVLMSSKLKARQKAVGRGGPGRWSKLSPGEEALSLSTLHESFARQLLNRYGIVFRELAMREALSPSWRELVQVYRALETRGEIRGGRFVGGMAGEQFALPECVELAREVRRKGATGERVEISAIDPLNLTAIVTPGPRVAATLGRRVVYIDGVPQEKTLPAIALGDADAFEAAGTNRPFLQV